MQRDAGARPDRADAHAALANALAAAGDALVRAGQLIAGLRIAAAPAPAEPPRALSISEAAKRLRCSRDSVERAIKRGDLRALRIGARVLLPSGELERFLTDCATAPPTLAGRRAPR